MSLPLSGLDRATTEALGWTLVHFLWQGALIAAALCSMDVILAKSRATHRYLAACLAFVLMLVVPIGTFFSFRAAHQQPSNAPRSLVVSTEPLPEASARPLIGRVPVHRARSAPAPSMGSVRPPSLSRLLPWVVQLWTLGVVVLSLRLIGGWWLVRRLVRSSGNVTIEAWQARVHELARRMGVSRPVRLCRSALVEVPTAVGALRPMILLPASTLTGLAPAQIEAILAHELAHIRRHDYLVNLLQNVVEMLLFYHPAVWWVSRRVREERELCCDDLAIRLSGDPVSYARTLCELERLRGETFDLALAASGGSLATRIARLLGMPRQPWEAATRGLIGAFGASAVLVLLALGGLEVKVGRANDASGTARVHRSGPLAVMAQAVAEPVARVQAHASTQAAVRATLAQVRSIVATAVVDVSPTVMATTMGPVLAVKALETPPPCDKSKDVDADEGSAAEPSPSTRFSPSEWERMRQHGIGAEYVRKLDSDLPGLTADQLVSLANHGVSSKYVSNLRAAGLDELSPEDLIQLANHGVSSEYVRGLKGIDPDDLTVDELVRLASNGVTSEWFSAMRWMGLSEFSVDEAIRLRNVGVTPEYANQLKLVTRKRLTMDDLKKLRLQGVSADYAARMFVLLGSDLEVDELVKLRNHGVSSEYAEQMLVSTRAPVDVDDLIGLRNQGVEPSYVYEMSVLGPLDPQELIRLRQNGVSAEFLEEASKKGYEHLSVDELIRLRQQGFPTGD